MSKGTSLSRGGQSHRRAAPREGAGMHSGVTSWNVPLVIGTLPLGSASANSVWSGSIAEA